MAQDPPHAGPSGAEAARIATMVAHAPHPPAPAGPGDDAAVLPSDGGPTRVVTTDAMVEGVHFLPGHPPAWLGWKLLAVNLSDVAAMGARPESFVVTAALPPGLPERWWEALSEGLGACARAAGATLVGGDVVGSLGPIALTVTAWGRLDGERGLLRSGGSPGDVLMVYGAVGRADAGQVRWLSDRRGQTLALTVHAGLEGDPGLRAHLRPEPPLDVGPWALAHGATAGMDLSDGLASDLPRLARASGVRLHVDLDLLPEDPACLGRDLDQRAAGGEDYGLVVLVPATAREHFEARGFWTLGIAEPAGRVGSEVIWTRGGAEVALRTPTFDHFRRNSCAPAAGEGTETG